MEFFYLVREALLLPLLGDLKFFHLAGLEGFRFLKAGNLFLEGEHLVCVFINLGGIGLDKGGHLVNLGVE